MAKKKMEKNKGEDMIYEYVFFYGTLCIIFLGLQGIRPLRRDTALAFLGIGNFNMLIWSAGNHNWELFLITVLMMIAQLTRVNNDKF